MNPRGMILKNEPPKSRKEWLNRVLVEDEHQTMFVKNETPTLLFEVQASSMAKEKASNLTIVESHYDSNSNLKRQTQMRTP